MLLLQATKEAGQLLLGGCLTFPNQRSDFRTRKPGCKKISHKRDIKAESS